MQRIEDNALIVSCDFCGVDWDGSSPVIEGHRGAIVCLECLKKALTESAVHEGDFKCVLCLREPIRASVKRWQGARPGVFACEGCILQAAEVFDKDPDIPWKWNRKPQ